METALSYITNLPMTLMQRKVFVEKAIEEIINGEQSALKIEVILKNLEEMIKAIRGDSGVKEVTRKEAFDYHEKTFTVHGAKFTKSERKTYNYSDCGDSKLNDLIAQGKDIDARIKERQLLLQALKPGDLVVDEPTGAFMIPPTYTTTEILAVVIL